MTTNTKLTSITSPPPSGAGECVAGCLDVLQNILVRLSVKPLIRCKLVSKQWSDLISEPQFAQSHVKRNPRSFPTGIFVDESSPNHLDFAWLDGTKSKADNTASSSCSSCAAPSLGFLEELMPAEGHDVKILQSCNGLLLCRFIKRNKDDCYLDWGKICVCNPTTRKYRLLPRPKEVTRKSDILGLCLAFDPCISLHYRVFCVYLRDKLYESSESEDDVNDDDLYVSRDDVNADDDVVRRDIYIYSSENQSWRLHLHLKNPVAEENDIDDYIDGMFWDGGIYWLGKPSLYFDLRSDALVERPELGLPSCYYFDDENDSYLFGFGVRDDHRYVVSDTDPCFDECNQLRVLGISKDHSKWVIKYEFSVNRLTSEYPEIISTHRKGEEEETFYDLLPIGGREVNADLLTPPGRGEERRYYLHALGVVKGPTRQDSMLLLAIPGKVIAYNFMKQTVNTLCDISLERRGKIGNGVVKAHKFVESMSYV